MAPSQKSPGFCAQAACIFEVLAEKAGNVHVRRDFEDVTVEDFLLSAAAIAPILERAPGCALGQTILDAVRSTAAVARSNTNLGIVLLLAPLAVVFRARDIRSAVRQVLEGSTVEDAELVYEAIRLARPGGLGEVAEQDIGAAPSQSLIEVMRLAEDRDAVARQYARGFNEVFETGLPALRRAIDAGLSARDTTVHCHLEFLAASPDSLIQRKCGLELAQEASGLARDVLDAGWPENDQARQAFDELDTWLRADGNRRNPGTSADLTVASLFLAIRDGIL
jgi:triphosphoribosyl-dephospho-CoA synthase